MKKLDEKEIVKNKEINAKQPKMTCAYLLNFAEYQVFEGATCHHYIITETLEKMNTVRDTYLRNKLVYDNEPQEFREVPDSALSTLCQLDRYVVKSEINYMEIREKFFSLARGVYQQAVDAAMNTDELEQCTKSIEAYLGDENWVKQLRAEA